MARQSVPGTSSGDRKSSSPTVDSRVRRTGSDDVVTDLIPGSVGWKSSSHRPGTSVTFHGSIWKPCRRACTENTLELSAAVADEGAEWTLTMKTPAVQQSLSLTRAAWVATTGCRLIIQTFVPCELSLSNSSRHYYTNTDVNNKVVSLQYGVTHNRLSLVAMTTAAEATRPSVRRWISTWVHTWVVKHHSCQCLSVSSVVVYVVPRDASRLYFTCSVDYYFSTFVRTVSCVGLQRLLHLTPKLLKKFLAVRSPFGQFRLKKCRPVQNLRFSWTSVGLSQLWAISNKLDWTKFP